MLALARPEGLASAVSLARAEDMVEGETMFSAVLQGLRFAKIFQPANDANFGNGIGKCLNLGGCETVTSCFFSFA